MTATWEKLVVATGAPPLQAPPRRRPFVPLRPSLLPPAASVPLPVGSPILRSYPAARLSSPSPVTVAAARTTAAMASQDRGEDSRLARIGQAIRVIPDFPKPGIMFQDITTLLIEPKAFRDAIDMFVERYRDMNISVVAGIEARGFIFGPPIALALGAKFVPMRKPNKLPGEVISEEYSLEYGTDRMEMHVGAVQAGERALVIDDLIATGGTLCAAVRLLETLSSRIQRDARVLSME